MSPPDIVRPDGRFEFLRQDWYFAVALALFVGVTVWFGRSVRDFFMPVSQTISTPSFVGQTLPDAVTEAGNVHVKTQVVARLPSDRYPKDVVMRQDPPSGAAIRAGRQVSLVVSSGLQVFPMPDLRYESMREVNLDLGHYKLQLGKTKSVASEDIPLGRVVDQDPPPLSSARVGTTVNVELSKGPPMTVRAPTFTGLNIDDARDLAASSKVRLGEIVWTPFGTSGPPHGTVVRQLPEAGAQLDGGERVSLQVSAGPNVTGYLVRQVHATLTVPSDVATRVRVQIHDETGTWNVFEGFGQPHQKLDFNLTVIGTAKLDMYVGDELVNTTVLGIEPNREQRPGPNDGGQTQP